MAPLNLVYKTINFTKAHMIEVNETVYIFPHPKDPFK